MKIFLSTINIILILSIQFGSTSFGYYVKSCSDKDISEVSLYKLKCQCHHVEGDKKSCCHKKEVKLKSLKNHCCVIVHFQNSFDNDNISADKLQFDVKDHLKKVNVVFTYTDYTLISEIRTHYSPPDCTLMKGFDKRISIQSFQI